MTSPPVSSVVRQRFNLPRFLIPSPVSFHLSQFAPRPDVRIRLQRSGQTDVIGSMRTTVLAILFFAMTALASAGTELAAEKTVVEVTPFDRGKFELQSSTGAYFSMDIEGRP